jgi:hypothetical protein
VVLASLAIVAARPLAADSSLPIQGTIALKGTMTSFYRGLNTLAKNVLIGLP